MGNNSNYTEIDGEISKKASRKVVTEELNKGSKTCQAKNDEIITSVVTKITKEKTEWTFRGLNVFTLSWIVIGLSTYSNQNTSRVSPPLHFFCALRAQKKCRGG